MISKDVSGHATAYMHETREQSRTFKAKRADQEQNMTSSIFLLLITKSSAFMVLSEITGLGGRDCSFR